MEVLSRVGEYNPLLRLALVWQPITSCFVSWDGLQKLLRHSKMFPHASDLTVKRKSSCVVCSELMIFPSKISWCFPSPRWSRVAMSPQRTSQKMTSPAKMIRIGPSGRMGPKGSEWHCFFKKICQKFPQHLKHLGILTRVAPWDLYTLEARPSKIVCPVLKLIPFLSYIQKSLRMRGESSRPLLKSKKSKKSFKRWIDAAFRSCFGASE